MSTMYRRQAMHKSDRHYALDASFPSDDEQKIEHWGISQRPLFDESKVASRAIAVALLIAIGMLVYVLVTRQ